MSNHLPVPDANDIAGASSPSMQQGLSFQVPSTPANVVGLGLSGVSPALLSRPAVPTVPAPVSNSEEGDAMSVPDDDSFRAYFQHVKDKYSELVGYVTTGKAARAGQVSQLQERLTLYLTLFPTMSSAQQAMFTPTIQETEAAINQLLTENALLESMVEPETQWVRSELNSLAVRFPSSLRTFVIDYAWPSLDDCQQLGLSDNFIQVIQGVNSVTPSYLQTDTTAIQREVLRCKQSLDLNGGGRKTLSSSGLGDGGVSQHNVMLRARIPQFEPKNTGDTEYARSWLAKYDWYCNSAKCTEETRMQDVALRLDGSAFTWFVALPKPTQQSWKEFSVAFLRKFACGLTSSEAALKSLKEFKKGSLSMHDFGTELTSLLHRANVYPIDLQLDYFEKLPLRIAEAFAHHDPTDFDDALRICTRLETRLQQMDKLQDSSRVREAPTHVYQEQNFQRRRFDNNNRRSTDRTSSNSKPETRTCFRCHKPGHIRKDCFVKMNDKRHNQNFQSVGSGGSSSFDNSGTRCDTDSGASEGGGYSAHNKVTISDSEENEYYGDNDDGLESNIFSHFLNNQQVNLVAISNPLRFTVSAMETQRQQPVSILVDTGSTLSTISTQKAQQLQLEQLQSTPCVITYGNKSTQTSTRKLFYTYNSIIILSLLLMYT